MSSQRAILLVVFFSFIIPVSAIQQTPNSSTQAAGSSSRSRQRRGKCADPSTF